MIQALAQERRLRDASPAQHGSVAAAMFFWTFLRESRNGHPGNMADTNVCYGAVRGQAANWVPYRWYPEIRVSGGLIFRFHCLIFLNKQARTDSRRAPIVPGTGPLDQDVAQRQPDQLERRLIRLEVAAP